MWLPVDLEVCDVHRKPCARRGATRLSAATIFRLSKDGLGDKAGSMIVSELAYDTTEPTIDSEIIKLKTSGANIFVDISTPKFAAQAIKKIYELGWTPVHILDNVASSIGSVIKPAGTEKTQGILSTSYLKDPTDPTWANDPPVRQWRAFMEKYLPDGDQSSSLTVVGYAVSETLLQVLKQCGDDLTRQNIMHQASNLQRFRSEMLLPDIEIDTSPTGIGSSPRSREQRPRSARISVLTRNERYASDWKSHVCSWQAYNAP